MTLFQAMILSLVFVGIWKMAEGAIGSNMKTAAVGAVCFLLALLFSHGPLLTRG